ncbi:hypothetical protein BFP72_17090 [Reichenbachiella sp. 5M10]|nr:hypothetical protein BFP72_17090 [Reichenbachiella sp. 5M10]
MVYASIDLAWFWANYTLKIQDVVLPLGIAEHIDISFMHGNMLPLYVAGVMSLTCVLAFFRIGPSWLYLLSALLLHLLYAGRFSIGEIPHSSNFVGLSILATGVGFVVYKDPDNRIPIVMGLVLFFVGFGYTTAAFSKLIATGFNWVDGRHLWMWMTEKSVDNLSKYGVHEYNFLQKWAFISIPVAMLSLIVGIGTEFFGFLLWFRKTRPFMAILVMGMHVGIFMTMNIWFGKFMMELIIIGFPWGAWFDKLDLSRIANLKLINK